MNRCQCVCRNHSTTMVECSDERQAVVLVAPGQVAVMCLACARWWERKRPTADLRGSQR